MSSRMTMILAALFLLGALLAGYWGFVLSRPAEPPEPAGAGTEQPVAVTPAPAPQPPEPLRSPIVVLRKALPANTPVTEGDVLVERLQVTPAGAFQAIEQVIGRASPRPLAAGSWLGESSFEGGGPLARMIRANERAVAIGVDEVIGAAGQMYPGDYVDVLLYLREETSNPQSSAQVVLPALRVLSVGEQMGLAHDGQPAQSAEALKARREQGNAGNLSGTRTVVLAVPEAFASRLMLAAQVGTLRLAVRSADEQRLARYWSGRDAQPQVESINRELFRFSQLSQAPLSQPAPVAVVAGMQVIRGAQNTDHKNTP
ncbi:Flp pilus assembly protein CpaB [Pseudomonas sp. KU43P]|uniref:Flp pilus assembly protein CpaB n=1 Tax=Pseudomonas sp. KU43P TaxID=2487887 RepID=UPI0012A8974D|nr:Flp pilus assembly protein CpaB [Pseudomonas sp. KU43P]BBH48019.1 Flp pilus assembly protein CpaB [Pseudomonas sp. KU43P]